MLIFPLEVMQLISSAFAQNVSLTFLNDRSSEPTNLSILILTCQRSDSLTYTVF